jgi:hypothetical protein
MAGFLFKRSNLDERAKNGFYGQRRVIGNQKMADYGPAGP